METAQSEATSVPPKPIKVLGDSQTEWDNDPAVDPKEPKKRLKWPWSAGEHMETTSETDVTQ